MQSQDPISGRGFEPHQLTVVVPAFMSKSFIGPCLRSLKPAPFRLQVIVIENGSAELSRPQLQWHLGDHDLLHLRMEEPSLALARNEGLREASGDWILFLDSDDLVNIDVLADLLHSAGNKNLSVISHKMEKFCGTKNPIPRRSEGRHIPTRMRISSGPYRMLSLLLTNQYSPVSGSHLYRRSYLIQEGLLFQPGYLHEDHVFNAMALLNALAVGRVDRVGLFKRVRPDSLVNSASPLSSSRGYQAARDQLMGFKPQLHRKENRQVSWLALLLLIRRLEFLRHKTETVHQELATLRKIARATFFAANYLLTHLGVAMLSGLIVVFSPVAQSRTRF